MNDYLDENIGCLGVIGIWAIVIAIIFIEPFITFGPDLKKILQTAQKRKQNRHWRSDLPIAKRYLTLSLIHIF